MNKFLFAFALLTVHAAVLARSAWLRSPVYDEPAHLAAGVSHWVHGRFDLFAANPPFTRMIGALPIVLLTPKPQWLRYAKKPQDRYEFVAGESLLNHNGETAFWLFTLGRWLCIPISLLGALVCYRWANQLYGEWAGLCAMSLWSFCPNILTHAAHITPDAAAAALGITAAYSFWLWLQNPNFQTAITAGLLLGVAELTKMTWLVLFVLFPIVWLVGAIKHWRCPEHKEILQLFIVLSLGLFVLNLGYAFHGTGKKLGDYEFGSQALKGDSQSALGNRFSHSFLGQIPVPLPSDYVNGVDVVKEAFEMNRIAYLGGNFSNGGWWYYYLYALGVKTPLGTLLLLGLAAVCCRTKQVSSGNVPAEFLLLLIPAVLLFTASVNSGINRHLRYVLPILPFVFVFASRWAQPNAHRFVAFLGVSALGWSIVSSLLVFPHFTAYFNELAGGPAAGHNHLISSNIDWGQDLLNLRRWLNAHSEIKEYKLAYYGPTDPTIAGLTPNGIPPRYDSSRQEFTEALQSGWYIVSVTLLRGQPARVYSDDGTKVSIDFAAYQYLLSLEPVARIGYSIYVYNLTDKDVREITRTLDQRSRKSKSESQETT